MSFQEYSKDNVFKSIGCINVLLFAYGALVQIAVSWITNNVLLNCVFYLFFVVLGIVLYFFSFIVWWAIHVAVPCKLKERVVESAKLHKWANCGDCEECCMYQVKYYAVPVFRNFVCCKVKV